MQYFHRVYVFIASNLLNTVLKFDIFLIHVVFFELFFLKIDFLLTHDICQ